MDKSDRYSAHSSYGIWKRITIDIEIVPFSNKMECYFQ